nr:wax ester/triacylglycerol synthase domain-containing protein [Kitasatospora sp. SID7827]
MRPGRAPDAAALDAETDRISRLPFDLGTEPPPWDLHLITGPDTFRICLRTHHGFLDGVGATHAAAALLADTPAEGARLHPSVPPTLRAAARTLYELARTLAGPRAWTPPPAPDSDPGPGLGSARQTAGRDVPLPVLRRIADAHGATVHQVALAALGTVLADLRREHHSDDARRPAVASVVMSTRTPAERHLPGNRLGVHRLRLPQRADTLDAALAAVVRRTAAARSRRRRDALRALLAPRVAPGLGVRLYAAALRADASPLVVSSVTLPDGLTAFGAPLRGAGLLVHAFEGFPAYVSFTRAAGLVRCHAAADPGRGALLRVPDRWAALLLAHDGGAS